MVKEEITKKIRIYAELDNNKNMTHQKSWDAAKRVLKESVRINDLSFHLKKLEKEEHIKTKVSGRQKIRKIRAEINGIHNGQLRKSTKPKAGSLKRLIKCINL